MDTSAEPDVPIPVIDETELMALPEVDDLGDEEDEQIEVTAEQCEMLYGVVLETAHGIIGTRSGKPHRDLPDERRKAQGKLLHHICLKYNIKIPTEFEIIIFGGALFADWQYMGAKDNGDHNDSETITTETTNDSPKK